MKIASFHWLRKAWFSRHFTIKKRLWRSFCQPLDPGRFEWFCCARTKINNFWNSYSLWLPHQNWSRSVMRTMSPLRQLSKLPTSPSGWKSITTSTKTDIVASRLENSAFSKSRYEYCYDENLPKKWNHPVRVCRSKKLGQLIWRTEK